ncbi:hypothetical protein [Georgenia sp. AZ-5]|uniref:hypothetical protein n=1 Tax=Georgenia sp. AZ-5 TaxID=3367526 RepID=UPI0037542B3B
MNMDDGARARDRYTAALIPPRRDSRPRQIIRALWLSARELAPGFIPPPTLAYLVITDSATGRRVARRPVDADEAGGLLATVQNQLERDTPERFRRRWAITT